MTVTFQPEKLVTALNDDPEFSIAAREWTTRIKLVQGERASVLKLVEGEVRSFDPAPSPFEPVDIVLSGTDEDWDEMMAAVPKPFYQDFFAALFQHGFKLEGDMESMYAYYPAVRRMADVMRATQEG